MIAAVMVWVVETGRPKYQVTKFQTTAPTRAAKTRGRVTRWVSTIPWSTVVATLVETRAPTKLRIAAIRAATRGGIARVETAVAIALAVSWKPLV